jgi:hypothetical protein
LVAVIIIVTNGDFIDDTLQGCNVAVAAGTAVVN